MPRFIDRAGQRYGRLTAVRCEKRGRNYAWFCNCDCGGDTWVSSTQLNRTKSCGCLQREVTSRANSTHGFARPGRVSPTYSAWVGAKGRCYNPADSRFSHYGGRGIRVCDRWLNSFENFVGDMGERPPGLTLERNDVNGDYEPDNCRWATRQEQSDNRRRTIWVEHAGSRLTLKSYAAARGIDYKALHYLVRRRGQDPITAADALTA